MELHIVKRYHGNICKKRSTFWSRRESVVSTNFGVNNQSSLTFQVYQTLTSEDNIEEDGTTFKWSLSEEVSIFKQKWPLKIVKDEKTNGWTASNQFSWRNMSRVAADLDRKLIRFQDLVNKKEKRDRAKKKRTNVTESESPNLFCSNPNIAQRLVPLNLAKLKEPIMPIL